LKPYHGGLAAHAGQSRPSRARGLKHHDAVKPAGSGQSRPSRARGLKQAPGHIRVNLKVSRPSRARGLKLGLNHLDGVFQGVAPLAGAWIETANPECGRLRQCPSRPSRARGLKQHECGFAHGRARSRPSRARGLKHPDLKPINAADNVAPLAGAWIETEQLLVC